MESEEEFRKAIIDGIEAHWNEVEMSHNPGFPDLEYCYKGICGQIELKHARDRNAPKLRSTQKRWFRERLLHQGRPMVWLWHDNKVHVIRAGGIEHLLVGTSSLSKWKALASTTVDFADEGGDPWNELEIVLTHP